jgi:glutaredoxin
MTDYIILTMDECKWCDKAAALLEAEGQNYVKLNLSDNPELAPLMRAIGAKTVPQVLKVIGGYESTESYLSGLATTASKE